MAGNSEDPVKTFSIGYKDMPLFDETRFSRGVDQFNKTEHYEFKLDYKDILDSLPAALDTLDEPFADSSAVPTYVVSQETKRHVTVALAGDGYLNASLERQAKSIGVRKNIIFTGWRKDAAEILDLFDILVLPSLNEGMGKALVEGMALGKPIVASSVGGIIDLVRNGENGILVPPRDSDALGDAILQLIKNKNLAKALGENGKTKVYPEFDASVMAKKIDDLYESLLISNCSLQK